MKFSEIAAAVESVTIYPLIGMRQDRDYILVDIGFVNEMGHASPVCPFIVSTRHLTDAVDGPEYLRILTKEACEKLARFIPQVAVHV